MTNSRKDASDARMRHLLKALDGRPIVLVGLMGAGKTTVGRRLANRLDVPFRDADDEIELAANLTISEIFDRHGETYFREGEKRVIARLLENGSQVLATGGGAWMNEQTRDLVKGQGVSVWLRAEFDVLMARVRRRSHRPLLQNADPEGVMRDLMAKRDPVYALADLVVDSCNAPHEAIVDAVVAELETHLGIVSDGRSLLNKP